MKKYPIKTRRSFLKNMSAGIIAAGISTTTLSAANHTYQELLHTKKKFSANDTIRIAGIGMGIMGFNNCTTALKIPGVELVAVCDLYDGRMEHAKEVYGKHLYTTHNYQDLLERPDIDAVIISTSDHWHDHISIAAMKKGKAVYCEKPMVHRIEEGKAVIDTQRATQKIFQVGSQRVSSIAYAKAKELYQQGAIGNLILVEAAFDRQSALGAWQYSIPPDASASTIDWERFIGDAPKQPFDATRFFRWRNYQDYGTGVAGDLFVHLFSGLHTLLDSLGPNKIYTTGGLRYWKDGRDVPDVMLGAFDYPKTSSHDAFNLQLRVNFIDGGGGGSVLRLIGTDGVMEFDWEGFKLKKSKLGDAPGYDGWDSFSTFTEATQKEFEKQYAAKYPTKYAMSEPSELIFKTPKGYSEHLDHHLNFIGAIRTNSKVVEDASFGLRAAAPSLAANKSYFEKRVIEWDPIKMELK